MMGVSEYPSRHPHPVCSCGRSGRFGFPVVGQEVFELVDGVGGHACQQVGDVVPQVRIGAACGVDEGEEGGCRQPPNWV